MSSESSELIRALPSLSAASASFLKQCEAFPANCLIYGERGTGKKTLAFALAQRFSPHVQSVAFIDFAASPEENALDALHRVLSVSDSEIGSSKRAAIVVGNVNLASEHCQEQLLSGLATFNPMKAPMVIATMRVEPNVAAEINQLSQQLIWKLGVHQFNLPPLRVAPECLERSIQFIHRRLDALDDSHTQTTLNTEALAALAGYPWPGNFHELEMAIHQTLANVRTRIQSRQLPETAQHQPVEITLEDIPPFVTSQSSTPAVDSILSIEDTEALIRAMVRQELLAAGAECNEVHHRVMSAVERELIQQVLAETDHIQTKASQRLGMNRNTLHKRIKELGLDKATPPEN